MMFTRVPGHVCYKQASKYAPSYTHTHTHTSQHRFHLQLFISPWHFEACSCLLMSLPPNSPFFFTPLLVHFICFMPAFHISVSALGLTPLSKQSVIKYFIMLLWSKWNISLVSCFAFFSLLLLHHRSFFLNLMSPGCNLAVTPTLIMW